MAKELSTQKAEFISRVRQAREEADLSQGKIAELLGIYQGKYKHYETNVFLPRDKVDLFCSLTGITRHWLETGEGPKRPKPRLVESQEATGAPPPRTRRSR